MSKVEVEEEDLKKVLELLSGPGHMLREVQVCRGRMFPDNPIDNLEQAYKQFRFKQESDKCKS